MLLPRLSIPVAFALCAAPSLPALAGAQGETQVVRPQGVAAPTPPSHPLQTLGDAFPLIAWDGRAHGILLAIAPLKAPAWRGASDSAEAATEEDAARQPLYAPTDRYGLNASLVARYYGRKLIHLSTMTVFAPTTMFTLSHSLKPANPYSGMQTEDKMRRLEASLTPGQWKTIGSPDGLGMGDLTRDQQPLFAELLPENTMVSHQKVAITDSGRITNDYVRNDPLALTDAQRQGLRVRLDRSTSLYLVDARGSFQYSPSFHEDPVGAEKMVMMESASRLKDSSLFGQPLRYQVPNRLKPSDLNLKLPALEVGVSVVGAKTVDDLVAATRKATGLELYVDRRLGGLPIAISGDSTVRASDLLEALCWALTATYRQLGPPVADPKAVAYVLTFDREGLAASRGRFAEWAVRGDAERRSINQKFDAAVQSQKPRQYLAFPQRDLLAATPEAEKVIEGGGDGQEFSPTVPASTLTPEQRQQLQTSLQMQDKEPGRPSGALGARSDRVGMSFQLTLTYMIPGIGEVRSNGSWPDNTTRGNSFADGPPPGFKPEFKPVPGAKITLAVAAPHDRAEAEMLVQASVAHGLRQLWIAAPDTERGRAALAECIAAGQARHLPIGALLSLMYAPAAGVPANEKNINLYGETGPAWAAHSALMRDGIPLTGDPSQALDVRNEEVLNPDLPDVQQKLRNRLEAVAGTAGLAGLALCDTVAPGYGGSTVSRYGQAYGSAFGYTPENRLAFLRAEGYDPIDLDPSGMGNYQVLRTTRLPFFDTDGNTELQGYAPAVNVSAAVGKWQSLLAGQQRSALQSLRTNATTDAKTKLGGGASASPVRVPIYITSAKAGSDLFADAFYQLWSDPENVPQTGGGAGGLPQATALSRETYPDLVFRHEYIALIQEESQGQDPALTSWLTEPYLLSMLLNNGLGADTGVARSGGAKRPQPAGVVLDLSSMTVPDAVALMQAVTLAAHAPAN